MGDPITVVIAEDHALVREGTRDIIEREPDLQVVGEAAAGDEAVGLVARLRPTVAILDVRMPKLNGIEAATRIMTDTPDTRVLIVSAHSEEGYVKEALAAGVSGYLLKTAPGRELVEAIRAVASGSTVLAATLSRRLVTAQSAPRRATDQLSGREFAVLRLIARGRPNKEIARELGISLRTVEGHVHAIFSKLRVNSRTEAVVCAVNQGLLSIESQTAP